MYLFSFLVDVLIILITFYSFVAFLKLIFIIIYPFFPLDGDSFTCIVYVLFHENPFVCVSCVCEIV